MSDDFQQALQGAREAMERGDPAAAASILQRASAAQPGRWEIQEFLGAALCESGDLQGGIDAFQQVVDLRPTNPLAHFNLAAALRRSGQNEEAARHLTVALRLDPRYDRALAAQAEWAREDAARPPAEDSHPAQPDSSGTPLPTDEAAGGDQAGAVNEAMSTNNPPPEGITPGPDTVSAGGADAPSPITGQAPPPTDAAALPQRFEPGAAPPAPPAIPRWEATPAHLTPGLAPGAGAYSSTGTPPPGGAKPRPTINDLPVKHEDDIPTLGQLFLDTIIAPRDALSTVLPAIAGAPDRMAAFVIPFLIAAILWGGSQVLEPGVGSPSSTATWLGQLPLSILLPFLLIGGQALVATILAGMLQRPAMPGAFRDLALRFGFIWAVTNLVCLGIALLALGIGMLIGTSLGAIPIAIYVALIWSFVLDVLAVQTLFNMDFGRSVLVALLACAVGDGLALALMQLVRSIG